MMLIKVEHLKSKTSAPELTKLLQQRVNDLQRESDKIRKVYSKNELSLEDFINDYMKSRKQFHNVEVARNRLLLEH
jgi:hypothetical protein